MPSNVIVYHFSQPALVVFTGLVLFFGWVAFMAIYYIGYRAGKASKT